MAFENKLAAVLPQAFTANGTTLGLVTVTDTSGFYIKQVVTIQSDTLQQTSYQIKNFLSNTQFIVGPINNNLTASPKNVSDISRFTTADNAFVFAIEQNNFNIPQADHYSTVFAPAPVSADRVIPVDPYGNITGPYNPLAVNLWPASQIQFTLGSLTLPTIVSQYLSTLTYTTVYSDSEDGEEILSFYNGSTFVGSLTFTKTDDGWVLNIGGTAPEGFLLLEDGGYIELESGLGVFLLE